MEVDLRPTPWLARRHAKEKSVIKNGGALRLGFWRGQNRTEFPLNTVRALIEVCWQKEATARPSFTEVGSNTNPDLKNPSPEPTLPQALKLNLPLPARCSTSLHEKRL